MPAQVTNYQCPACTGPLHYAGSSGKLECEYCSSTYEIAEIEKLYAEKEAAATAAHQKAETDGGGWDTSQLDGGWGAEAEQMRAYSCPSCGAELICDETTAATSCPYCGNPTVVPGQFAGTLKPDYVIPFKLDKKAAKEALKNHYKGKTLLPKAFAAENHIEEIKGVYVPFWLFDGEADADVIFHATRSTSHREGDEQVTVTQHYHVRRAGSLRFERIPVDASTKMPDEHMDAIEPFDYSEIKPFSTAYLPGFLADKYDVEIKDSAQRADERATNTVLDAMRDDVTGYETCTVRSSNVNLKRGEVHYALMPVWMLNTKWNGQDYLFAMNGQTGKMVGDLPISKGKLAAWFGGVFAVAAAVLSLIF
ncbi:MAG: hypothetical protein IJC43_06335 [Clostridia bacterium]|nr:hypothetical protein [Clostridia bacterium]